ncbi:TATA-binding protein-associated factor 172, partial [Blattella germanica]
DLEIRLDRLFVLLETGSSGVTRRAAAKQLGEVQRLHPHELHHLLSRITTYLHSPTWETRIAAGQAVEAVIQNVPQWDPPGCNIKRDGYPQSVLLSQTGRLSFQSFDMNKVLANSTHLMASEGKEFDVEEEYQGTDIREKMARQRQLLNTRLGLDVAAKIGMDMTEFLSIEDLTNNTGTEVQRYEDPTKRAVGEVVQQGMPQTGGLSSREMNRARRKARQAVFKQRSREAGEDGTSLSMDDPAAKRPKLEEVKQEDGLFDCVPDSTGSHETIIFLQAVDWPFEGFCDQLCQDLFSPSWEVRHGAGTALREVIRVHGRGAGKAADTTKAEMDQCHQLWLEDISLRLLCVLALDRFGDFVSDQVVAPVRETCAQALGSVLNLMNRNGDLVGEVLPKAFHHILEGLGDPVDDVGAVAASALIPVAARILSDLPEQLEIIVQSLWDLLQDQDELAAACNSFMGLLAALLSLPNIYEVLTHNTSSVRRATLQTLRTLTAQRNVTNGISWTAALLQEALRHIFQRVIVESVPEIQELSEQVWGNLVRNGMLEDLLVAACPFVSPWLCLTMQPAKLPIDPTQLIQSKSIRDRSGEKSVRKPRTLPSLEGGSSSSPRCDLKLYVGGSETTPTAIREKNVTRARCMASRMLGLLSCYIVQPAPGIMYTPDVDCPVMIYVRLLLTYLNSKSALQRLVAGLVIVEWARLDTTRECHPLLKGRLYECLTECVYYDEIALSFTKLLQEARDFVAMLRHYKLPLDSDIYCKVLTLEHIQQLSGPVAQQLLSVHKLKPKVAESLEERRRAIQGAASQTSSDQTLLSISTQAALAGAVTMLRCLPEKLNPVIKPLMESIKKEDNEQLQSLAADHLACLVDLCSERVPCPNPKIVSNLCTFLKSDTEFTPKIQPSTGEGPSCDSGVESVGEGSRTGTPTSFTNNYTGILTLVNQQRSAERAAFRRSNSTGGRGPGRPPVTDIPLEELFAAEDNAQKQNRIQRRGASFALTALSLYFGKNLPQKLPKFWEIMIGHLKDTIDLTSFDPSTLINADAAAEELVSSLQVLEVTSPAIHPELLPQVLEDCLPRLCLLLTHPYRAVRHMAARCMGALACLSSVPVMTHVVDKVLPLLGSIDSDIQRQGAVEALACISEKLQFNIVPYIVLLVVPLLGRMSDQNQPVRLMATHCFATLIQLMPLDGGVPDPPNLTLELAKQKARERKFLEQLFNPKSIEDFKVPIPIQAELRSYQQKTKSPDCAPLPSIVICPPTLTGHWVYEVEKFLSRDYLYPLQYIGPPAERDKLRHKVKWHNLVVASYDIVRKDIDFFSSIKWNYCILDEGHVIKNGKTKSSKAIKQLVANHRLILSGTPIQNNVLELWSLFDFLMPGFLGTEKQMKEDVLQDLPPKITQDYYCELSPLQEQLYEDFARSQAHQSLQETLVGQGGNIQGSTHIFQALRYLQNVCNHPKLVLTQRHPEYEKITQQLKQQSSNMADIQHAAKLPALKTNMPSVTYLRLDGSIPPGVRHSVVTTFNNDPSIDVLLLTTQVGGLGLNLTGADTVIFVEHDWNPMKDLQAMDRAHRIGQKKVVNVYRLITRGTLEEKIMGLQKFKLMTANTVISSENASMETMGTDQLLDLFSLEDKKKENAKLAKTQAVPSGTLTMKTVLETLPDLWEEKQYEEEYDLSNFVNNLRQ